MGTPTNSAIVRYVNQKRVPHLFLDTSADKWGNHQEHPWTIGFLPSNMTEAQVYTKYLLAQKADAKIGILYQNDDFGKDYIRGVRDILRGRYDEQVTTASYEVTDATIDSQLVSLQSAGIDVLMTAATPKFAAQSIRKVAEMNWRPMHVLTRAAAYAGAVMIPAGPENGVGIISSNYEKDPTDPHWDNDAGMQQWRAFMANYYPDGDLKDGANVTGFSLTYTMLVVLKNCGQDLSRENMLKAGDKPA